MFGPKLSSVLAGGILLLGSGAMAFAQAGGPPDELPDEAATQAQGQVETLELGNETATNAVQNGDGTAFSDWVKSLDLEGCERGLTIAANARNGPLNFETDGPQEVPADHPALQAGCDDGTVNGSSEEGGESFGRDTAAERSGGKAGTRGDDAGPPSDVGPPSHAGPPSDPGPTNSR